MKRLAQGSILAMLFCAGACGGSEDVGSPSVDRSHTAAAASSGSSSDSDFADAGADAASPSQQGSSTPLVVSFDGTAPTFVAGGGAFALSTTQGTVTDWPTARTPWLALDRDGSGTIDDGSELFGSATRLASGALARNGFEALAALDDNGDGVVDARDGAWTSLLLWADENGDRIAQPAELTALAASGIRALPVVYASEPHCDARGNCAIETAQIAVGERRTGALIDVHLKHHAW